MFHSSSQKSNWIFKDANEIAGMRQKANSEYVSTRFDSQDYLTYEEEKVLLLHYEYLIKQFCGHFEPPITMPAVVGTSVAYFKRFYLKNSVIDYHPKNIHLVCIYLACKVEEFNVSIGQFVQNVNTADEKDEISNVILSYELLLIEKLNFNLTIHNFYRPFEGFLVDIKTKCPEIKNVEVLRQSAMDFLDKILNTDAMLLYPPSQIALTALVYSSSKNKVDSIDKYCRKILLNELNDEEVKQIISITKQINRMLKEIPSLKLDEINRIEMKLNECYNVDNDPRSEVFQEKVRRQLDDEEEEVMPKNDGKHLDFD